MVVPHYSQIGNGRVDTIDNLGMDRIITDHQSFTNACQHIQKPLKSIHIAHIVRVRCRLPQLRSIENILPVDISIIQFQGGDSSSNH